jgi:nicotinamidase/pyrazinamidase
MRLVRLDIDTQHDFCHPRGALYVPGAERVIPKVAALNRDARERRIVLLGSVDAHDYASAEFDRNGGPWPVHCVKGTWGQLKVEELLVDRFRMIPPDPVDVAAKLDPGWAALYFEKDHYSVFSNPNFERVLSLLGPALRFQVYGVATDYCVKAAALELASRGHEVGVVLDACAGVAPETTERAIAELEAAGVRLLSLAEASSS